MNSMLRNYIFAAVFLSLASTLSVHAKQEAKIIDEGFFTKLDEYMQAVVQVKGFSGAILLAHNGKPLLDQGYGMASVELNVPNTPDNVFLLGSITKQFTGMAVAMLQEREELKVTDLACKYLDSCPTAWATVTIRDLLWHTSGIPSYTSLPTFPTRTLRPINTEQMLGLLADKPMDFDPGEGHAYSNSGYFLLGSIVEAVSGHSYADFLQLNIFSPLGMTHTAYDDPDEILLNRAAGYARRNGKLYNAKYMDMSVPFAAGALRSTTHDLLLWDQALYTDKLVNKQSMKEILTPHEGDSGYAYGWSISRQFERAKVSHGGGIYGFSTDISRFPDQNVTVIVLSNIEGAPSGQIASDLAAIYFGEDYEVPQEAVIVAVDPAVLASYAGEYQMNGDLLIAVTPNGNALAVTISGRPSFDIVPTSVTRFLSRDVDLQFEFVTNASGKVSEVKLNPGPDEMSAKKIK